MEYNKVIFYCFSGTGNTLSAVRSMAEVFESAGKSCVIKNIPHDKWENEDDVLYIFAFPVYEQGLPLFVYDWISTIPNQKTIIPAAALSTLASSSGFVKTPLRVVLEKKNFLPLAVREIIFPTNFIYSLPEHRNTEIMKNGMIESRKFAEDIISGKGAWPEVSKFKKLFFPLNRFCAEVFSWIFSHYKADDSCIHCHLCENLCPVVNIRVTSDNVIWGRKCQVCLRCINFCPRKSIKSKICNLPYKAHYIAEGIKAADLCRKTRI